MEFILLVLAAIAVHRIWNYELIFEPVRRLFPFMGWFGYMLGCPVCNAFWICIGVALTTQLQHWGMTVAIQALASYSVLRLVIAAYHVKMPQGPLLAGMLERLLPAPSAVKAEKETKVTEPKAESVGCPECEKKKQDLIEEQKRVGSFKRRVVIMTTLSNFNPSYSVSTCVLEQARALATVNPDWLIQVWVMQITNDALWPKNMPPNVELRKVIPSIKWMNDAYDPKAAGILAATVSRELVALGNADVITHDLLLQSAYLNFAAAIHSIKLKGFNWWHQAHSGPSPLAERPSEPVLYRYSLPKGHRLLGINVAHNKKFKQHYGLTDETAVDVCSNVRDPRTLYGFSPEIGRFIAENELLTANVVQVYPVSTERSFAKGVQHVIRIFGSIKHLNAKVRLVIANAHANNNESFIQRLKAIGEQWGLTDKELIFTSEHFPKQQLSSGLSARDTQALFQISNLFVFPTTAEASSLVLAEAALGGNLIVLNRDVPSINFDIKQCELTYPFGVSDSPEWPSLCPSPDQVASEILGVLNRSPMNITKRSVLAQRNLDTIGRTLTEILNKAH